MGVSFFESFSPKIGEFKTTPQTQIEPASGPRPASSTPQT